MNSIEEDSSFEVLENSKGMATPKRSSTLRAQEETVERLRSLCAHSHNMVKNLKDHIDQFGAQEKHLHWENPEENEDQRMIKVKVFSL